MTALESSAPPGPGQATPLTVVGIGASAGGLTALRTLFSHVPADTGMAWVVIVHLSPEHESHLAQLLQPYAAVPVIQVTETVELKPDHIYVIPPNANLNAIDTHLRLTTLDPRPGARATVDHFFRTLSNVHDGHSIGVVLTGTGSDGALGIREIKLKHGLAVAQDPEEAEYDGMPRSAIATGMVDLVLPLADIPAALLRYAGTRPRVPVPADGEELHDDRYRLLQQIFALIRNRTGRDFSQYKRSTILRRIIRRMQLSQVEDLSQYLRLLHDDADEPLLLADDLLINVTSFFRDPAVFDTLARDIIPQLFHGRPPEDEVRVWTVGCATGEEAYSLAMLLIEEAQRHDAPPEIRVFASDLHEHSVSRARDGFYPGDIEKDVSAERLQRFFHRKDGGYRISAEVRERVVFCQHNMLGDPPFSRIDLLSCRNVLIYLQHRAQTAALELFHYALNPDGVLVLGTAERAVDTLFEAVDKEQGLFRRRNAYPAEPRLPAFSSDRTRLPSLPSSGRQVPRDPIGYGGLHQRIVERFASPSILVGPTDRVVHISAGATRYLVQPGGEPTNAVLRLLQRELAVELEASLAEVRGGTELVRSRPVEVLLDGIRRSIVLDVRASADTEDDGHVLVLFHEAPIPGFPEEPHGSAEDSLASTRPSSTEPSSSSLLEAELELVRHRLHAATERHEASRSEMSATNEELLSANEELRATMEELETSKEELQSMNEELQTLNQENRHKVEELAQMSSDLQNLLISTDIATLFLDRQLRIMRFTPNAEKLFHIRDVDRGRPLSDLRHVLAYDALHDDAEAVLQHLTSVETEVQDIDKRRWYLARVLPYRSPGDRIGGVVLTFVDITAQKEAEASARRSMIFAESIVETLHEPLLVLTPDLRVKSANPAMYDHFGVDPHATVGRLIYELGNGQWNIPELRTVLEQILPQDNVLTDFEVRHTFEDIGERVMLLDARRLDHVDLILVGIRDITERAASEEAVRRARAEAEHASSVKSQFLSTISHELRTPLGVVIGLADLMGNEVVGPMNTAQRNHLDRIQKSAWHLVGIIDEILTFSRAESGRETIHLSETDLVLLMREVAGMLASAASEAGCELSVDGPADPVIIPTDGGKVRQILINLVGNAFKYAEGGPVELELRAEPVWTALHVRDHGPGIPADRLDDIFDPFTQLQGNGARRRGTGLGLTIARRYAVLLGGQLTVHSEPGVGSTFTLRLPRSLPPGMTD